jgi:hypothetical protein
MNENHEMKSNEFNKERYFMNITMNERNELSDQQIKHEYHNEMDDNRTKHHLLKLVYFGEKVRQRLFGGGGVGGLHEIVLHTARHFKTHIRHCKLERERDYVKKII